MKFNCENSIPIVSNIKEKCGSSPGHPTALDIQIFRKRQKFLFPKPFRGAAQCRAICSFSFTPLRGLQGVDPDGRGSLFFTPFPDIVAKQAFQFCRTFLGPIDSAKGRQRENLLSVQEGDCKSMGKWTFSRVPGKVDLLNFAKI